MAASPSAGANAPALAPGVSAFAAAAGTVQHGAAVPAAAGGHGPSRLGQSGETVAVEEFDDPLRRGAAAGAEGTGAGGPGAEGAAGQLPHQEEEEEEEEEDADPLLSATLRRGWDPRSVVQQAVREQRREEAAAAAAAASAAAEAEEKQRQQQQAVQRAAASPHATLARLLQEQALQVGQGVWEMCGSHFSAKKMAGLEQGVVALDSPVCRHWFQQQRPSYLKNHDSWFCLPLLADMQCLAPALDMLCPVSPHL